MRLSGERTQHFCKKGFVKEMVHAVMPYSQYALLILCMQEEYIQRLEDCKQQKKVCYMRRHSQHCFPNMIFCTIHLGMMCYIECSSSNNSDKFIIM